MQNSKSLCKRGKILTALLPEHTCHSQKAPKQESDHQRTKQKRQRVSEMGNPSVAVLRAKGEEPLQNDQLSHRG